MPLPPDARGDARRGAALGALGPARAGSPDRFVGFGDSTMDSGYFRYNTTGVPATDAAIAATVAAGGSGAFGGPGPAVTDLLAARFGLSARPFIVGGGGGTNYANGAAQTAETFLGNGRGVPGNVPIVGQISAFLGAVHGVADRDALYMISTGANDLLYVQTPAVVVPPDYLTQQIRALAGSVVQLQAAGARTIVVLDIYEYARLVDAEGHLSPTDAADLGQAHAFSRELWSTLAAAGVRFVPGDVESLTTYVSQHPTEFGFTPATVLASSPACGQLTALVCAPYQLVAPDAEQTYLFADVHHLTTAGQAIEADYLYSLLTAPSQISLLAETAVQDGLARMATIQGQIDPSGQHRGPNGVNVWVSAGADSLRVENNSDFPDSSGTPFTGTVGADYLMPGGLVVGAAMSVGGQRQDYSSDGHFDQFEEALSLYTAYGAGPWWGNAILSYGFLQNDVDRDVRLGTATDRNSGDPDGHRLAGALRGGHDFHIGAVTTGPVAGLVLQQVRIDGFTEHGDSGVTALSFDSQTRNSAVSQLGWRGALELGDWQPFADIEWNHEWASDDNTVTASLTSVAAPSFTAAAAPAASDWATASLGASYRLNSQVTIRGATSAVLANPHVDSYGGELSLHVAF